MCSSIFSSTLGNTCPEHDHISREHVPFAECGIRRIENEPDLGTIGGTYPTTFWCPPAGHTNLGDYLTLIRTAGPQIHAAFSTLPILIGVLGSPVADGSAWFNTSTGIFSSTGWASPPSQVSASYHPYLGDAANWPAQYAQDIGGLGYCCASLDNARLCRICSRTGYRDEYGACIYRNILL